VADMVKEKQDPKAMGSNNKNSSRVVHLVIIMKMLNKVKFR